jgi:hypothetical protein
MLEVGFTLAQMKFNLSMLMTAKVRLHEYHSVLIDQFERRDTVATGNAVTTGTTVKMSGIMILALLGQFREHVGTAE